MVERVTRKNENLESELPLTISAQYLEYNAKVNSAETIARVLGGKSEDKSEAEKPAEKKKTTRRKSTSKAASKTPPKKTGGRKKKSDNPEGTGESQMSTL